MRPTWAEISLTALQHNFRTIQDYVAPEATVCCVVKAARKFHRGSGHPLPVHMKIDTGMARLGVSVCEIGSFAEVMKNAEHVTLEGIFTHLASAEVLHAPDTEAQMARFEDAVNAIRENGLHPVYRHMANSAAIVTRSHSWKNMVRP